MSDKYFINTTVDGWPICTGNIRLTDKEIIRHLNNYETEIQSLREQLREKDEIIKQFLHLHHCEMEGISGGMPAYEDWMNIIIRAEQSQEQPG